MLKHIKVQPKQCRLLYFTPSTPPTGSCIALEIEASSDIRVMLFDETQGDVFAAPETRGDARPILSWIGKRSRLALGDLPPSFYVAFFTEEGLPIEVSYYIGVAQIRTTYPTTPNSISTQGPLQ